MKIVAREPWLVQRMFYEPSEKSFRRRHLGPFRFDYMGAAEFERGQTQSALDLLRTFDSVTPETMRSGDHRAYYVGPFEVGIVAQRLLNDQLENEKARLLEATRIRYSYGLDTGYREREPHEPFDGWWCVDTSPGATGIAVPWALFRTLEAASAWVSVVWDG